MDTAVLKEAGIDYESGLRRFMGDRALYEEMLDMFVNDDTMARARTAMEKRDYQTAFECAHELKGACGNLDITGLYRASAELADFLRNGCPHEGAAAELFSHMESRYAEARLALSRAAAGDEHAPA